MLLFFSMILASVLEDPNNKEWIEMDKRWLKEQKEEFHEMDENHDGVLTKDELLVRSFFVSFIQSSTLICLRF